MTDRVHLSADEARSLGEAAMRGAGFDAPARADARAMLDELGLGDLVEIRARRRVERHDNREVWGAEQEPRLR